MAYALKRGTPQRASGELTFHVLDIMHAIHEAAQRGSHVQLESTCQRPAPLAASDDEGVLWPAQAEK